jgi:hypothetical protein
MVNTESVPDYGIQTLYTPNKGGRVDQERLRSFAAVGVGGEGCAHSSTACVSSGILYLIAWWLGIIWIIA